MLLSRQCIIVRNYKTIYEKFNENVFVKSVEKKKDMSNSNYQKKNNSSLLTRIGNIFVGIVSYFQISRHLIFFMNKKHDSCAFVK